MTQHVHKVMIFIKRRPGISVEAFRDHYENIHVPLCSKYFQGLRGYRRNHLNLAPTDAGEAEPAFDVVTELWYDDRATAERVAAFGASGNLPPDVIADEERFIDRAKTQFTVVTVHETDLGA